MIDLTTPQGRAELRAFLGGNKAWPYGKNPYAVIAALLDACDRAEAEAAARHDAEAEAESLATQLQMCHAELSAARAQLAAARGEAFKQSVEIVRGWNDGDEFDTITKLIIGEIEEAARPGLAAETAGSGER